MGNHKKLVSSKQTLDFPQKPEAVCETLTVTQGTRCRCVCAAKPCRVSAGKMPSWLEVKGLVC